MSFRNAPTSKDKAGSSSVNREGRPCQVNLRVTSLLRGVISRRKFTLDFRWPKSTGSESGGGLYEIARSFRPQSSGAQVRFKAQRKEEEKARRD